MIMDTETMQSYIKFRFSFYKLAAARKERSSKADGLELVGNLHDAHHNFVRVSVLIE